MRLRWTAILFMVAALFIAATVLMTLSETKQQANAATATVDSPYGFTDAQDNFKDSTVDYMHDLKLSWIRSQLDWARIETAPGVYDWSLLDATVNRANAGNVNLVFPIRNAPTFHLTQTCTTTDGLFSKQFPGPADMAQFATQIVKRYKGRIAAIQIGNEEWDNAQFGNLVESAQCRQPRFYAPVLAAAYKAIKAVDSHVLVIDAALFWKDTQHQFDWYSYLYANGFGNRFDVGAFNYYLCNFDPAIGNGATWPKFGDILGAIKRANNKYKMNKPIWVTESGWNINANAGRSQSVSSLKIRRHNF